MELSGYLNQHSVLYTCKMSLVHCVMNVNFSKTMVSTQYVLSIAVWEVDRICCHQLFLNGDTIPHARIFEYFSGWLGGLCNMYNLIYIFSAYFPWVTRTRSFQRCGGNGSIKFDAAGMPLECFWNADWMPRECRRVPAPKCRECIGNAGAFPGMPGMPGMPRH